MAERWCQHISAVHLLALERSSDIKTFPVVLELSHSAWCGSHSLLQSAFLFFSQPVRQKLFFPQCPDKRSLSSSASICPCWILSTSLYGGGCSQLNLQSGASGLSWLYNGGARLISMSVLSTMTINSGDASGQTWLSWESSYEGGKELSLQGKRDIWCIVSYIYINKLQIEIFNIGANVICTISTQRNFMVHKHFFLHLFFALNAHLLRKHRFTFQ